MKIAIFYHCLFFLDGKFLPSAFEIIQSQMAMVEDSGLLNATSEMVIGINGGGESLIPAGNIFPAMAKIILHGEDCHTECKTILALEQWLPGHEDFYVLYFHSKGATRPPGDSLRENWRACMMRNLVKNWRTCIADLGAGYEMAGCHWMSGDKTPPGQSIFAGNFWWAKAMFLKTLPSILKRDRIKQSGIGNVESRYESEVWIGNGPKLPVVKDYHPEWISNCKP